MPLVRVAAFTVFAQAKTVKDLLSCKLSTPSVEEQVCKKKTRFLAGIVQRERAINSVGRNSVLQVSR